MGKISSNDLVTSDKVIEAYSKAIKELDYMPITNISIDTQSQSLPVVSIQMYLTKAVLDFVNKELQDPVW